jgi:nucleoside-diphosphate-sugar epimerase/predicted dehydrogenase
LPNATQKRVGIVGAGYISAYHVKAVQRRVDARVVAVCDLNRQSAERIASLAEVAKVYTDVSEMLREERLDVVHVLTQPDSHFRLARMAIESGSHVILEKPATVSAREADELKAVAATHGRVVAVNHNFLQSRPMKSLLGAINDGVIGPLKSVRIVWRKVLGPAASGPWGLWMLRAPENMLLETGSHSFAEMLSVLGEAPEFCHVSPSSPRLLPSGVTFFRRWNMSAKLGNVAVQVEFAFDAGVEQHCVEVEGLFGIARADIEQDVFEIVSPTGSTFDLERLKLNTREGLSRVRQALRTYSNYAYSKLRKGVAGGPYDYSMLGGIDSCYEVLSGVDHRTEFTLDFAAKIAVVAESVSTFIPVEARTIRPMQGGMHRIASQPELDADVLVIGATGFIGKRLLQRLAADGRKVRAMVRNASALSGISLGENLEIVAGDYRDEATARRALAGVSTVFHLAVAHSNSYSGYLKADSEPTVQFARVCQASGVRRFVYSGTIDSLDLSKARTLTEEDGVDRRIKRRNNYARSKAYTESKLRELSAETGLPLVVVRPAIVLGSGGPIAHVGVANWFGLGACEFWGRGDHPLPIVLVEDVADALAALIDSKGSDGKTYNLSAKASISAREYVAELEAVWGCRIRSRRSSAFAHLMGDMVKWLVKLAARHPDRFRVPSLHDWRCREQHAEFDSSLARRDLGWEPECSREALLERGIRRPAREQLFD